MTPVFDPDKDTQPQQFDLLPVGDVVFIVEDSKCAVSKKMNKMYAVVFKPFILVGNYGNVYCNLMESVMTHMFHSFCEASGLSQGHVFPPVLRNAPDDPPNSFMDIEVGRESNLISANMIGRVVIGTVKHGRDQNGKPRHEIDINGSPPFKVYEVNGEPYAQPVLITNPGEPSNTAPAPDQQTLAPPSDLVDPNEELEHTIEDV